MTTKISAWDYSLNLSSPDGQITAVIDDAHEFGQGSPTTGTLVLSNGLSFEGCNPSVAWSDDSKFLAVPQWRRTQYQRLLVISIGEKSVGYARERFSLLELHSFSDGKIKGIDSPAYKPREIEVDLSDVRWEGAETTFWERVVAFIGFE
ncbi:MAG TPA: hypothetical protein VNA22_05415 [Pyrinomonadaceae bacterium]|nr:hypothetical protein [Pyrinomonadaceae bacterium]